jgi:hypothetical protein
MQVFGPVAARKKRDAHELSIAAEPEWLNPDYDDDERATWELTEQDQETADILIGEA